MNCAAALAFLTMLKDSPLRIITQPTGVDAVKSGSPTDRASGTSFCLTAPFTFGISEVTRLQANGRSLSPEFHVDPTQLTEAPEAPEGCEAPVVDDATLRANAYALDQQYDFRFNGSYATNWGGQGEKWVVGGNNNWFYILPDGELVRWNSGSRPLTGDVISRPDATFHADPSKLHDAQDPNAGADVPMTPSSLGL